jgi:hypothetical protein
VVIVFSYIWYLTSGIKEISSATKKGQFYVFIFAGFQKTKKKRVMKLRTIPIDFCVKFDEMDCIFELLSKKEQLSK